MLNKKSLGELFLCLVLLGKILLLDRHELEAATVALECFRKVGKIVILDFDTINPQLERFIRLVEIDGETESFAKSFDPDRYLAAVEMGTLLNSKISIYFREKECIGMEFPVALVSQQTGKVTGVHNTSKGDFSYNK